MSGERMHFHFFLFNGSICDRYDSRQPSVGFRSFLLSFATQTYVELSVNVNWAYLEDQMQEIRPTAIGKREINGNHNSSEERALQDSSRSSSRRHSSEQRGVK